MDDLGHKADTADTDEKSGAFLLVRHGQSSGDETFCVRDGHTITIGRAPHSDICLIEDKYVARCHCEITAERGRLFMRDLGHPNLPLVNGHPSKQCEIRSGDVLRVGLTDFTVVRASADA